MAFRAASVTRALLNVSRSSHIVRSLSLRTRPSIGFVAKTVSPLQLRGFQTTVSRRLPADDSPDSELSKKLGEELKLEASMDEGLEIPQTIKDYLQQGPFKVTDVPGSDKVTLTRTYGSENITVDFSISVAGFDNELDEDYNWDEDDEGPGGGSGMADDEDLPTVDSQSGRVMNKPRKAGSPLEWLLGVKMAGYTGGAQAPVAKKNKKGKKEKYESEPEEEYPEEEDFDEELETEEDWEDDPEGTVRYPPIQTRIQITKGAGAGTLTVDATCTDAIFVIDNVRFDTASAANPETAQSEYEASSRYSGPPWQQLDEDLQLLFERYLEERGINSALAMFIPDYAELKEQKEYTAWLKNLKAFVDK